ncbi:D-alanyl-D-alanine carboxypeptidase [Streptomyces sp. NPDC014733]|uniref:D-alanyl-D-alanine carboxypeptidase family protein n=1 Tax=Streptomyces sp. NPDC014733 TaxID=3364885 RepID=UPI0036FEBFCC
MRRVAGGGAGVAGTFASVSMMFSSSVPSPAPRGAFRRGAVSAPGGSPDGAPGGAVPGPRTAPAAAPRVPAPRGRRAVSALALSALLVPPVVAGGTAYAADGGGEKQPKDPAPPAVMSRVGGERLGVPGVQVQLKDGAPKVPRGISARSWIVSDAESGEVLAAKNPHWQLPPASTLKMLFADTVLPKFPKGEKYTVKPADLEGMGAGSSLVGIKENLTYTVHDLWLGVFLRSGNDAVHTLSAMNGGTEATVAEMRQRAKDLNAVDTHVVTPDGYDAPGQVSSAYDLSLFARAGLQNADFREYCATATAQFPGDKGKGGKRETFGIQNTNRLLTGAPGLQPYPGIAGVKNGYTTHAGNTLTAVAQHGARKLLVTLMNPSKEEPNESYKETAALFDWGFEAAGKVEPVGRLVGPRSEEGDASAAGHHGAAGDDGKSGKGQDPSALEATDSSGGAWTAVGVAGGALVVVGAVALVVRRRRPLPEAVRREARRRR